MICTSGCALKNFMSRSWKSLRKVNDPDWSGWPSNSPARRVIFISGFMHKVLTSCMRILSIWMASGNRYFICARWLYRNFLNEKPISQHHTNQQTKRNEEKNALTGYVSTFWLIFPPEWKRSKNYTISRADLVALQRSPLDQISQQLSCIWYPETCSLVERSGWKLQRGKAYCLLEVTHLSGSVFLSCFWNLMTA